MANGPEPVLIGLCGRSGSGKGVLSSFFAKYGVPSIDTDAVYRSMTGPVKDGGEPSPCMKALAAEFGDEIVAPDGSLDRARLAATVFSDREALKRLNRTAHVFILDETERRARALKKEGYPVVLIDAPALFESGFDKKCRLVIAADAPDEVLIKRITSRDGISEEEARLRLSAQVRPETLPVDLLIDTDRPLPDIENDIRRLSGILKERFEDEI